MAYDVTILLDNQPGQLATMGEVLGKADINIEGMCGFLVEGKGDVALQLRMLGKHGKPLIGQRVIAALLV